MIILIIVILEFFFIYFLSRGIFTLLHTLFYLPLKHQTVSNHLVSFLFLPGTMIHEFSHALIARLLGVQVGEINVYPHKDKDTGEFKAGSIEIEQVDPLRLSLIGIAPSLVGILILVLSVFYLYNFHSPILYARDQPLHMQGLIPGMDSPYKFILLPVIFIISMTMFTSKKDLRELLIVGPFIALVSGLLYYVGFRISLSENLLNFLKGPLISLAFVLGFTLIIDLLIYIFLFVPVSLILSVFEKKLK